MPLSLIEVDPLISVIVPVYNVENYLPRCLQAISEQTYQNLEIILVDDGSSDRSGFLCDEYAARDTRARVIHQPNTGLWAARNVGQDAAHGDYLFFPDGDDYFHRDLLRILYEAISSGGGYDLAICQMKKTKRLDEDVSSSPAIRHITVSQEELFQHFFLKYKGPVGNSFSHFVWNKLFRRQLIENHRNKPYPVAQDRDYLMRLYPRVQEAVLVDRVLYYWVQRPASVMHSPDYLFRRLSCFVEMDKTNYLSMAEREKRFAHYALEDLYMRMLFWRNLHWASADRNAVFNECKTILANTQKAFLLCKEIPLLKRVLCLILAYCPNCTHWLIRVSGNE